MDAARLNEPAAHTEARTGTSPAPAHHHGISRRGLLRIGGAGVLGTGLATFGGVGVPYLSAKGWLSADGAFAAVSTAIGDQLFTEVFPTSPLILDPFVDELPVPEALRPLSPDAVSKLKPPPGPGPGEQNSYRNEQHQIWPSTLGLPDPIVYEIDVLVRTHSFTSSQVLPIDNAGNPTVSFDADLNRYPAGTKRSLPPSTIYGFNGTFPGPMINAEYGKPALVRFSNHLDENPMGLDRQDFGSPVWQFLTHLHNGHTAPESDGNPHYAITAGPHAHGFFPTDWVDQLYLNHPAGGDETEKQSFFWFHDHTMDFTGANVYKGMVGLYPIYDPKDGTDMGDERQGLRLPGVRTNHADGSFDVKYDIPLAIYDCRLDDGVTLHHDIHDDQFPDAHNPRTHPEWWGMTFHRHFPNHGFVGDIFTVNGTAYPVLQVDRRKYRFRFLDCSVSRIYEFKMMSSTKGPKSAVSLGYSDDELDGQYRIPDGQQCMQFTEIATDGGLLPFAIKRDSFELWPAKRREVIIDFTRYLDGHPTTKGDVVYLTNIMKMEDGRMWDSSSRFSFDPDYMVPMVKFVIGDDAPDASVLPGPNKKLRDLPPLPADWRTLAQDRKIFEVKRGSAGGEIEWLINGVQFDPENVARSLKNPQGKSPLALQPRGSFAVWEIRNGGGGWVHPFHLHMEEHRTLTRNGVDVTKNPLPSHPDDRSREDLVALDPGESVLVYRGFRTFVGPYVAHCHNLLHEDHAMMFAWSITPP
ncbi:MAG: multicopper oxidase domain-containing protein [Nocardioidaceae bacterium]|nr:multicopper oxidase domain-containing protein [Nocardioidaceae bacterium]NUS52768.1 multicopper oxidase domain-containing protein [Nocardioidaceae bacterium]